MADGDKNTGPQTFVGVACAAGALGVLAWACAKIVLPVESDGSIDRWHMLGLLAVAVAIAFAVAAMLRFALAPLIPSDPSPSAGDGDAGTRSKIGPMVLAIGSGAIVVLAIALIISFAILAYVKPDMMSSKVDVLLTNVFTTVLPVVATWVGTVLAFYFGSENFRQAAQSTRDTLNDRLTVKKKVFDTMKHYDNIAKFEVDDEAAAENGLTVLDMIHTFSAAAPRVMVFKKGARTPIYIIRSTTPPMPPDWVKPDFTEGDALKQNDEGSPPQPITLKEYLDFDGGKNREDARKFVFIGADATTDEALALMNKQGVDDLFITKDGLPASPVLGWVCKNDLMKP